jgi:hypothetical protein
MYKKYFKEFMAMLDKKMTKGFKEYGDKSFKRKPKALANELEEELLDIVGWGLILYVRMQELKKKL